jgi:hypothetical protein
VALSEICRKEGPVALLSGIKPTLLGVVPYAGLSFMFFETSKAHVCTFLIASHSTVVMSTITGTASHSTVAASYSIFLQVLRIRGHSEDSDGLPVRERYITPTFKNAMNFPQNTKLHYLLKPTNHESLNPRPPYMKPLENTKIPLKHLKSMITQQKCHKPSNTMIGLCWEGYQA